MLATGQANSEMVKVAVLYSDRDGADRVMRSLERIEAALNHEVRFMPDVWRQDLVSYVTYRKAVTRALAESDMIVITVRRDGWFSEEFRRWIEAWPEPVDERPRALVAYETGEEEAADGAPKARAAIDWLETIAAERGIDFLRGDRCGGTAGYSRWGHRAPVFDLDVNKPMPPGA